MQRLTSNVPALLRRAKLQQSPPWPMLQGRKEPPQQPETEEAGESGPITPAERERFHENPEEFAGDARFVGTHPGGSSEGNG